MLRQLRPICWNENMPVHAPPLDCSDDCFRYPRTCRATRLRFFKLCELSLQCAHLVEASCHVAHDCGHADHLAVILERHDGELDGDRGPILANSGNREHIALAVAAFSALHHPPVSIPMPLTQPLRNNEVERARHGLVVRITEEMWRSGVPEADDAVAVSSDDCVGRHGQNGLSDRIRNVHDSTSGTRFSTIVCVYHDPSNATA